MTRKYRTSGLTTTGTSPIAATTKKKSKSKGIFKAVTVAALGAAGLSALGGWGSGTTFMSGLTNGWGKATESIGSLFGVKEAASVSTKAGDIGKLIEPTKKLASTANTGSLLGSAGTGLKGIFDYVTNMSSGSAFAIGSILKAIGEATNTEAADQLAFSTAKHEDQMDYNYAALEQEKEIADALIHQAQRETGVASTFMGHTNPIAAVEGLNIEEGYQPKPPKNYPDFHPTGGLLS